MRAYIVTTSNAQRTWHADDAQHALEQHADSFQGEAGEDVESVHLAPHEEPDTLMRWTVELGHVPGLGDDCALDVFTANTHAASVMFDRLLNGFAREASGSTTNELPDYITNPTREV